MKKNYAHKTAMIVDDSKVDRFLSAAVIKSFAFAENVESFPCVSDGLNYLRSIDITSSNFPLVIFLDLNMPDLDGFDFLDGFLKMPESIRKQCHIIMVSSSTSKSDLDRVTTYSAIRRFYSKPLSIKILSEINEILELEFVH
jgi:CheY-like chemotaxis protein